MPERRISHDHLNTVYTMSMIRNLTTELSGNVGYVSKFQFEPCSTDKHISIMMLQPEGSNLPNGVFVLLGPVLVSLRQSISKLKAHTLLDLKPIHSNDLELTLDFHKVIEIRDSRFQYLLQLAAEFKFLFIVIKNRDTAGSAVVQMTTDGIPLLVSNVGFLERS